MTTCSFCDQLADSKEHVIPKWLQRHFDLKDQKLGLSNQTQILYRDVTIPACRHCNNERFSRLEDLVCSNKANEQQLYLWALKIRYGLALKDSTLLQDRKYPEIGMLLSHDIATYGEPFIRHAFLSLDRKNGFHFQPFPFGSVFLFPHSSSESEQFDFVDIPPPNWALAVTLPSRKTLAVLFADRGVTKKIILGYAPLKKEFEQIALLTPGTSARTLMFQLLRWQIRLVIPDGLRLENSGIKSQRIPRKIRTREATQEKYRQIAAQCGLPDSVADYAFSRDKDSFNTLFLRHP